MSILTDLQAWFAAQCNGEWEHHRGVSIQSTDNPGWWVKIDLVGTPLEGWRFEPVSRGEVDSLEPGPPWLHCYVENGVFNGAGDPARLEEILEIFKRWVSGT